MKRTRGEEKEENRIEREEKRKEKRERDERRQEQNKLQTQTQQEAYEKHANWTITRQEHDAELRQMTNFSITQPGRRRGDYRISGCG